LGQRAATSRMTPAEVRQALPKLSMLLPPEYHRASVVRAEPAGRDRCLHRRCPRAHQGGPSRSVTSVRLASHDVERELIVVVRQLVPRCKCRQKCAVVYAGGGNHTDPLATGGDCEITGAVCGVWAGAKGGTVANAIIPAAAAGGSSSGFDLIGAVPPLRPQVKARAVHKNAFGSSPPAQSCQCGLIWKPDNMTYTVIYPHTRYMTPYPMPCHMGSYTGYIEVYTFPEFLY
jgi:hypothetical protein